MWDSTAKTPSGSPGARMKPPGTVFVYTNTESMRELATRYGPAALFAAAMVPYDLYAAYAPELTHVLDRVRRQRAIAFHTRLELEDDVVARIAGQEFLRVVGDHPHRPCRPAFAR